jgi:hypothetical protein
LNTLFDQIIQDNIMPSNLGWLKQKAWVVRKIRSSKKVEAAVQEVGKKLQQAVAGLNVGLQVQMFNQASTQDHSAIDRASLEEFLQNNADQARAKDRTELTALMESTTEMVCQQFIREQHIQNQGVLDMICRKFDSLDIKIAPGAASDDFRLSLADLDVDFDSPDSLIGSGAAGKVYWGKLRSTGAQVAV